MKPKSTIQHNPLLDEKGVCFCSDCLYRDLSEAEYKVHLQDEGDH